MPADVFAVLANPVRRRILSLLRDGPRAVGDLAANFDLGRPAISEHLQVLRRRLVGRSHGDNTRYYHLEPLPLAEVKKWKAHPLSGTGVSACMP